MAVQKRKCTRRLGSGASWVGSTLGRLLHFPSRPYPGGGLWARSRGGACQAASADRPTGGNQNGPGRDRGKDLRRSQSAQRRPAVDLRPRRERTSRRIEPLGRQKSKGNDRLQFGLHLSGGWRGAALKSILGKQVPALVRPISRTLRMSVPERGFRS